MDLSPERQHEPLHPELIDYVQDLDYGRVLRHPLVYQVPLFHNGLANDSYAVKRKQVAEEFENGNYDSYISWHERPYRLSAFLDCADLLDDKQYWELAADIWTDSENIHQMQEEWREVFSAPRKGRRGLMTSREYGRWRGLPNPVTVYRGCRRELNEDGWSWTLDREKAEWFANRYGTGDPVVIEGRIVRKNILAVFLGRSESEVVAFPEAVDIVKYWEV